MRDELKIPERRKYLEECADRPRDKFLTDRQKTMKYLERRKHARMFSNIICNYEKTLKELNRSHIELMVSYDVEGSVPELIWTIYAENVLGLSRSTEKELQYIVATKDIEERSARLFLRNRWKKEGTPQPEGGWSKFTELKRKNPIPLIFTGLNYDLLPDDKDKV